MLGEGQAVAGAGSSSGRPAGSRQQDAAVNRHFYAIYGVLTRNLIEIASIELQVTAAADLAVPFHACGGTAGTMLCWMGGSPADLQRPGPISNCVPLPAAVNIWHSHWPVAMLGADATMLRTEPGFRELPDELVVAVMAQMTLLER